MSFFALLSQNTYDFSHIAKKYIAPYIKNSLFLSHKPQEHKDIYLLFDGDLYNLNELKLKYKILGDKVLIELYLLIGLRFIDELRGEFRLAIIDKDKVYLATDHLGTKPLFYMQNSSFFAFSTSLNELSSLLGSIKLSQDAMLSYLSFLAPTPPYTFFDGIYKIPSSSILTYNKHSVSSHRYYNVLDTKTTIFDKHEAIHKLEEVFKESLNLRATNYCSTLLSGGIDSAAINYFLKDKNPTSYTLGYKNFLKYDERANAKTSSDLLCIKNIALEMDESDFFDSLDELCLDEPLNDPAIIPLHHLLKRVKKDGYDTVFSGEGSDELFLGYRQYFEFLDIQQLKNLKNKNFLSNYFHSHFSMTKEWERYKRVFDNTLLFRSIGENFTDLQKNHTMIANIKDNESLKYINPYRELFNNSSHKDESLWYSFIDLELFVSAHSLAKLNYIQDRVDIKILTPFLDKKFIQTIFSIDPKLRYEELKPKYLLKQLLKPHIPDTILNRKKKGFSNPFMEYLIKSNRIELITKINNKSGIFKKDILKKQIDGASSGAFKGHLWGLYMFSVWLDKYL